MKQRKPSKMKAALIFEETIAHYFWYDPALTSGELLPFLIKVCFTELTPWLLIIQGSLDSMYTKSTRHWNTPTSKDT